MVEFQPWSFVLKIALCLSSVVMLVGVGSGYFSFPCLCFCFFFVNVVVSGCSLSLLVSSIILVRFMLCFFLRGMVQVVEIVVGLWLLRWFVFARWSSLCSYFRDCCFEACSWCVRD